ncbi:MAG: DUF3299 domain-containing protein [Cyclobacteriaceae bacterium]|nr:DUF3299 domain-containing protein [Cyclobacteriaceae bacterium HetDA_MAG_MS6]
MLKLLILPLFFATIEGVSQAKITWETLEDVNFTDRYSKELDAYYYYPHFGSSVKALQGKEVFLQGHILVINPSEGIFILSRNPYSSCFFCGNGGPESIVELKLKSGHPRFKMDQIVTIKGILKLNRQDVYHCNYIFEEAEVYDRK